MNAIDPSGLIKYTYSDYWDLGPVSKVGDLATAVALFEHYFKLVFPFPITGCSALANNAQCILHAAPSLPIIHGLGSVRVSLDQYGFTFTVDKAGYFDKIGSTVAFSICQSGDDLFLNQQAHGDASNLLVYLGIRSPAGARYEWSKQSGNLRQLLYELSPSVHSPADVATLGPDEP